jgi:hypothetical protein
MPESYHAGLPKFSSKKQNYSVAPMWFGVVGGGVR